MSKGSGRRPRLVSREEYELRWALAYGDISKSAYARRMRELRKKHERRTTR